MKAVMKSVSPRMCEKVANGDCTILVSKTAPKCGLPFKGYICVTKGKPYLYRVDDDDNFELTNTLRPKVYEYVKDYNEQNGKVIGEFVCDKVYEIVNGKSSFFCNGATRSETNLIATQSCLDFYDMAAYLGDKNGCGWHISDLKIYDKPKELREFYYCCKEMKANEPRAGKYVSLSCYACRRNALKRTEDYSEYNNMLGYICKRNITRPPQSWYYVEEL